MSEKNSSRASLFIAIIAIFLILGGVFLLNKSFSDSSRTAVASNAGSQTKSTPANKSTITRTETSDTSVTAKPVATDIAKDQKIPASPTTSTSTTTTGTIPSVSTATTVTTATTQINTTLKTDLPKSVDTTKQLAENEILAKFVGEGTGGLPKFEIQECGNKSSRLCVSPNKFIINNANKFDINLTEGRNYRFVAKYNEDQNFIIFEAIQSIVEVR